MLTFVHQHQPPFQGHTDRDATNPYPLSNVLHFPSRPEENSMRKVNFSIFKGNRQVSASDLPDKLSLCKDLKEDLVGACDTLSRQQALCSHYWHLPNLVSDIHFPPTPVLYDLSCSLKPFKLEKKLKSKKKTNPKTYLFTMLRTLVTSCSLILPMKHLVLNVNKIPRW